MEDKKLMKAFTESDMTDFATMWKSKGDLLRRLEDVVLYDATIELVESKREKELVKLVVKMQNDLMEAFFAVRKK